GALRGGGEADRAQRRRGRQRAAERRSRNPRPSPGRAAQAPEAGPRDRGRADAGPPSARADSGDRPQDRGAPDLPRERSRGGRGGSHAAPDSPHPGEPAPENRRNGAKAAGGDACAPLRDRPFADARPGRGVWIPQLCRPEIGGRGGGRRCSWGRGRDGRDPRLRPDRAAEASDRLKRESNGIRAKIEAEQESLERLVRRPGGVDSDAENLEALEEAIAAEEEALRREERQRDALLVALEVLRDSVLHY